MDQKETESGGFELGSCGIQKTLFANLWIMRPSGPKKDEIDNTRRKPNWQCWGHRQVMQAMETCDSSKQFSVSFSCLFVSACGPTKWIFTYIHHTHRIMPGLLMLTFGCFWHLLVKKSNSTQWWPGERNVKRKSWRRPLQQNVSSPSAETAPSIWKPSRPHWWGRKEPARGQR